MLPMFFHVDGFVSHNFRGKKMQTGEQFTDLIVEALNGNGGIQEARREGNGVLVVTDGGQQFLIEGVREVQLSGATN